MYMHEDSYTYAHRHTHTKTDTDTHRWVQTPKLRKMQIKFFSFLGLTEWKAQGPSKSAQIQNLSDYNEK